MQGHLVQWLLPSPLQPLLMASHNHSEPHCVAVDLKQIIMIINITIDHFCKSKSQSLAMTIPSLSKIFSFLFLTSPDPSITIR
jgi:hypothetical protein